MQILLLHLKPAYLQIAEPERITSGVSSTLLVDQFGLSQQQQCIPTHCCALLPSQRSSPTSSSSSKTNVVMFIQLQTGFHYFLPFPAGYFLSPIWLHSKRRPCPSGKGERSLLTIPALSYKFKRRNDRDTPVCTVPRRSSSLQPRSAAPLPLAGTAVPGQRPAGSRSQRLPA